MNSPTYTIVRTSTCHTWCTDHDHEFGFCHSEPALIADITVHLAAPTSGVTRLYLGTAGGQYELPVDVANQLFDAGLAQVELAKGDEIVTDCATAGVR